MGVDACIEVRGVEVSPDVLRKVASSLAERLGPEQFWLDPEKDQHCLEFNKEGIIEVNTFWRYYGPDYERGPWPEIRYTLLYLMECFPEGKVYYFGDSGGLETPVTIEFLNEMDKYFLLNGHVPYHSYFGHSKPVMCNFCQRPMMDHGGGGGNTFFQCHGCNQKYIKTPTSLEKLGAKEDFFAGNQRLRES